LGIYGNIWVFNATVNTYIYAAYWVRTLGKQNFFDDLLDKL